MKTEIFEADPFTNNKAAHLLTVDTDYRFETRDEFFLTPQQGQRMKVRVAFIRLELGPQGLRRELIVMKL